MVLNWRGPLLAAAIFAAVFSRAAAHGAPESVEYQRYGIQLTSGPLRHQPAVRFLSSAPAYQVERSQDEDSLSDQNASRTTAFFIGGYPVGDWETENGKLRTGGKFRGRLENFLARGGRVVLVRPAWELKSESQGWEVENKWNQTPDESGPAWVSPDLRAMPAGSEMMYLAADAPWLKTDADWTALYADADGRQCKR